MASPSQKAPLAGDEVSVLDGPTLRTCISTLKDGREQAVVELLKATTGTSDLPVPHFVVLQINGTEEGQAPYSQAISLVELLLCTSLGRFHPNELATDNVITIPGVTSSELPCDIPTPAGAPSDKTTPAEAPCDKAAIEAAASAASVPAQGARGSGALAAVVQMMKGRWHQCSVQELPDALKILNYIGAEAFLDGKLSSLL
jgi:hypothetical protein